jgi:hypothetical protein
MSVRLAVSSAASPPNQRTQGWSWPCPDSNPPTARPPPPDGPDSGTSAASPAAGGSTHQTFSTPSIRARLVVMGPKPREVLPPRQFPCALGNHRFPLRLGNIKVCHLDRTGREWTGMDWNIRNSKIRPKEYVFSHEI